MIPNLDGLRPTADRTRETLFNWLQFDIPGMSVLDLFAGTGALGLEALSRGAQNAVFVEPQSVAANGIRESLSILKQSNAQVVAMMANQYVIGASAHFDLVFVDPPFSADLWDETLALLLANDIINDNAYVYLECPKYQDIKIPESLATIKDKTAGKVRFRLLQKI